MTGGPYVLFLGEKGSPECTGILMKGEGTHRKFKKNGLAITCQE